MNNQEYELDLVDLGKTILKRWKLLVLVTVVVAAVVMAMVVGANGPASYESSALLSFHLTKRAISISNASEDGKQLDSDLRINMDDASTSLSQRINAVSTLSPIVSSILTGDEALQTAIAGHESEVTLAELRNGMLVEAIVNTDLIKISVQAKSPEIAVRCLPMQRKTFPARLMRILLRLCPLPSCPAARSPREWLERLWLPCWLA